MRKGIQLRIGEFGFIEDDSFGELFGIEPDREGGGGDEEEEEAGTYDFGEGGGEDKRGDCGKSDEKPEVAEQAAKHIRGSSLLKKSLGWYLNSGEAETENQGGDNCDQETKRIVY